jgi:hypothetical protein
MSDVDDAVIVSDTRPNATAVEADETSAYVALPGIVAVTRQVPAEEAVSTPLVTEQPVAVPLATW